MIKNAGSTLNSVFIENYGHNYLIINDINFNHKKLKKIIKINKKIEAIGGHPLRPDLNYKTSFPNIKFLTF